MADRTSSLDPYEPESSYDWDYGEPEARPGKPKVLWGRIGTLAAALIVAFLVGRLSAPDVDPRLETRVTSLEEANDELTQENEDLEQQLRNLPAAQPTVQASDQPDDTDTVTYIVKPGDTLRGIAQKFYCDPEQSDFLAAANGIEDPTTLSVGDELSIPPNPNDACD